MLIEVSTEQFSECFELEAPKLPDWRGVGGPVMRRRQIARYRRHDGGCSVVSGIWSWERDTEHVEKAFDFAGMGARNGVTAALMAQAGFTGVPDVLDGEHNALQALSREPRPEEMIAGLGSRFFITETAIKEFSVGYPIQAALDAFLTLRREHALTLDNVDRIVARLPEDGARIVDDRAMPDVNLQYVLASALIEGTLSFDASHSY